MNNEQVMVQTFTQTFRKYIYEKLIIGKLAHVEFKDNLKKGTEIDVIMPAQVTLFDYTGGNLQNAEEAANSLAKVRIDKGKAFHFFIDEVKEEQIQNAPDLGQKVKLAKEYCDDAIEQFAAAVDDAYSGLWVNAGHKLTGTTDSAITLTPQIAKEIFSYMQAEFKRGDRKGHTNWVDGKMLAIVPPEYQFYLTNLEDLKYVESGHKKMARGEIGQIAGWRILVSNNVKKDGSGNFYPLFGIEGKTLAGGIQKKLNMKTYEPDENFNKVYKGYGLYGVGAPRADLLGYAKISAELTLTTT